MSTGEPLFLQDYSPVEGEENILFCQRLQAAIKKESFQIVNLGDFLEGNQKEDKKPPKVFGYYNNKYGTKSYAGVLEFEGRTVTINSRFDHKKSQDNSQNNTYFLQYCLDKINFNRIPATFFMNMHTNGGVGILSQLLIPIFLLQVETAYNVGVFRQYRNHSHNDSKVRGPIDITRHIRLNAMNNGKIAYNTRDYTIDNPTNHLILQALQVISQNPTSKSILDSFFTNSPELKIPFQRLTWELGEPTVKPSDIRGILEKNRQPITHPFHRNYDAVRRTALMILQEQGLNILSNKTNQVQGFILSMASVWEKLLEETIFNEFSSQVTSQKNIPIIFQSDDEGKLSGSGKRELKPVFYGEDHSFVLDAKYKRPWVEAYNPASKWSSESLRADVFQLISYLYVAKQQSSAKRVRCGVLFPYTQNSAHDPSPEIRNFSVLPHAQKDGFHLIPCPVLQAKNDESYEAYAAAMDKHWIETSNNNFREKMISFFSLDS